MQHPQYSFMGKQSLGSSGSVPGEGYSVFQNAPSVADSYIESAAKPEESTNVLPEAVRVDQSSPFGGKTHNFSDQDATTWQWGASAQNSQAAVPVQEPLRVEHVPVNDRSFAPPADLGRLQRFDPPEVQRQFSTDIYKSPIDRPYVGRPRKTVDALQEANQAKSTLPQRDEVTESKEFLPRDGASETLFAQSHQEESLPGAGKNVIVLRSQSPQELAKARASEAANSQKPDAQLLTPNFESYVGSPVLDATREVYQEQTEWKVYTPKPEHVDLPPQAIFQPRAKISVKTPAIEHSPLTPANQYFQPAQEVAGLPEPPPAPKSTIKEDLFQPPPAPVKVKDIFGAASVDAESSSVAPPSQFENSFSAKPVATDYMRNTSVNRVSASKAKVKATTPSYRFERYETDGDLATNTQATTVAHTTPVAPAATEPAWLSPWWMLVCLIPMAMYLVTRRGGAVDEYYDACDEVGERPRLPPEMIEKPGYSKSDAIYGDKDEYFATEQIFANNQRASIADRLPMATHLKAAGHESGDLVDLDDLNDLLSGETGTTDSAAELHFADSNSVQTDTELDGDASPNFRSELFDVEDDDSETPDWLR